MSEAAAFQPHLVMFVTLARLSADERVTTAQVAASLCADRVDRAALADPRRRRQVERHVRGVLDGLVDVGCLVRRDRGGRHGAHAYELPAAR